MTSHDIAIERNMGDEAVRPVDKGPFANRKHFHMILLSVKKDLSHGDKPFLVVSG